MATDTRKLGLGAIALVMAAGALLVGLSEVGAGV